MSKVKLFGGGEAECKILRKKESKHRLSEPEEIFEITYCDPKCGYEKIARYPRYRITFSKIDDLKYNKWS